jgi:hypothetical protein
MYRGCRLFPFSIFSIAFGWVPDIAARCFRERLRACRVLRKRSPMELFKISHFAFCCDPELISSNHAKLLVVHLLPLKNHEGFKQSEFIDELCMFKLRPDWTNGTYRSWLTAHGGRSMVVESVVGCVMVVLANPWPTYLDFIHACGIDGSCRWLFPLAFQRKCQGMFQLPD